MFTDCNDQELYKKFEMIHLLTAHKREDNIIRFLKGSENYNFKIRNIISEIIKNFVTCNRLKKPVDKPKVSLSEASKVIECVSIHLKDMRQDNR